jgi:hypothetical protein
VVDIPGQGGYYRILIKPDGSVHSKILNNDIVMFYTFTSSRPDVNFTISSKEQVNYTALKLNYELIYGGTDGKSITITYREYTGQDLVRPAFFQNLVYDRNEKNIRFRDTMIQIYDVTNEKIVFTVLSDGL